jgi:hypothetical protein
MLSYLTWQREITDVTFAFTQLIKHLANAEREGGFELASALLKRVGRHPRDHRTLEEHGVVVTMPLPKHDFDVALVKGRSGECRVTVTGLPRYAGFSFSCTLPSRTLLTDLQPDPAGGVSWRARKLFTAIRQDQRSRGASCSRQHGPALDAPGRADQHLERTRSD